MARHNHVTLYGRVPNLPVIETKENKDGSIKSIARLPVSVVRRFNKEGARTQKIDTPLIETTNDEFVDIIRDLKVNDLVEIKGVLRSKPVVKGAICPHCHQMITRNGVKRFVHPLNIRVYKRGISEEEAIKNINENAEISNNVYFLGYLCGDPEIYIDPNKAGRCITQYTIAVDRKVRLQDDNTNSKSDYLWVKSYGQTGEQDYRRLKKGSCVAIDGYLQTKVYMTKRVCEFCHEELKIQDASIEVVPISSEYCNNFRNDEQVKQFCEEKGILVDPYECSAHEVLDGFNSYAEAQNESFEALVSQGVDDGEEQ